MNNELSLPYCIPNTTQQVLYSSHKQLEYRLMIAFPTDEPPANGYPVIYALDGNAVFATLAEAARLQTRKPHGYDPVVIVGIGYPSEEPFDMTRRCYDFTMPADARNLPVRPNGQEWPENGGADAFLDFIERELAPAIASQYPIDAKRQTIFGHSLGGLFVLHALFTRPHAFQHYVAGSPSIWWNQGMVLQEKEAFATAVVTAAERPRLLVTVGADEHANMVEDAEQLVANLQQLAGAGFHSAFLKFPDEGHVSVLPAVISKLLKFSLGQQKGSTT